MVKPDYFSMVKPDYFSMVKPHYFSMVKPDYFSMVKPDYFSMVKPDYFSMVKPDYFSMVKPDYFSMVKPDYFSMVKPDYFSMVKPDYLSMVKPDNFSMVKPDYFSMVIPDYFSMVKPDYFSMVKPDYFSMVKPDYFSMVKPVYSSFQDDSQFFQVSSFFRFYGKIAEPPHDKTNKMAVRQAKTQTSLGIQPVASESLLCAQWVGKDPSFLHADCKDSDQTGRMPRLIWDMPFCWICHVAAHLLVKQGILNNAGLIGRAYWSYLKQQGNFQIWSDWCLFI